MACALILVRTRRNMLAGTTCTSSSKMKPHSRLSRKFIIFCDVCDRLPVLATIEYVDTTMPDAPENFCFSSAVNTLICESCTLLHCRNCCRHCITLTLLVHSTKQLFLIVQALSLIHI